MAERSSTAVDDGMGVQKREATSITASPNSPISSSTSPSPSTPFDITTTSSSSSGCTGNIAFDHDYAELAEYFDCNYEAEEGAEDAKKEETTIAPADTHTREQEQQKARLLSVIAKLPFYAPNAHGRVFITLHIRVRLDEQGKGYQAQYRVPEIPPSLPSSSWPGDEMMASIMAHSQERSEYISRARKSDHPTLVSFVESFYYTVEERLNPDKPLKVRDFCYSVYDPRHWGRPLPGQLQTNNPMRQLVFRARAKFDFVAGAEGELTVRENDLLLVFANLGNGWLSARRQNGRDGLEMGDHAVGLIPESYVQRI